MNPFCCKRGEAVYALVDGTDPPCTGYQCPEHGWQWVGDVPWCVCTYTPFGRFRCSHPADGPDRLCKECRDHGHMRGGS